MPDFPSLLYKGLRILMFQLWSLLYGFAVQGCGDSQPRNSGKHIKPQGLFGGCSGRRTSLQDIVVPQHGKEHDEDIIGFHKHRSRTRVTGTKNSSQALNCSEALESKLRRRASRLMSTCGRYERCLAFRHAE